MRVSVVVVSRHRPAHLRLCLTALRLQDHPEFEIIVVADPDGLAVLPDLKIKRAAFDVANISEARNIGIDLSAGEVIAFIDDDSIAEPGWLTALSRPFHNPDVIAATGWTRDRTGFGWQTRTQRITRSGRATDLVPSPDMLLLAPECGAPVSTIGTNCAFRAANLRNIGGFDPVFAWHLDESDLNMRMADACPTGLTAVVPQAQVTHARAGAALGGSAAPRLSLQGRSSAIFARRHGGQIPRSEAVAHQRGRLLRRMINGELDPFRVQPVLDTYSAGLAEGDTAPLFPPPPPRNSGHHGFTSVSSGPRLPPVILAGWRWQAGKLRAQAARSVREGAIVTVLLLTPTFTPHRLVLCKGGWFEQTGGLWGASDPDDPAVQFTRLQPRISKETGRIAVRRNPRDDA